MRALVGSEGSTGAVKGESKAMLAKLRAESGISSRSSAVIIVLMVLLVVSTGWVAREGPRARTWMDCFSVSGPRMTANVAWLLTETVTREVFSTKPVARTAMV